MEESWVMERAGCTVKTTARVVLLCLNNWANDDCVLKTMDHIDQVAQAYHQFTAVGSECELRAVVKYYSLCVDLSLSRYEPTDYLR